MITVLSSLGGGRSFEHDIRRGGRGPSVFQGHYFSGGDIYFFRFGRGELLAIGVLWRVVPCSVEDIG